MNTISKVTMQPALLRPRCLSFILAVVLSGVACGGKSQRDGNPKPGGTGGFAAGGASSSGTSTGDADLPGGGSPSGGLQNGGHGPGGASPTGGASALVGAGGTGSAMPTGGATSAGGFISAGGAASGGTQAQSAGGSDGGLANSCSLAAVSHEAELAALHGRVGYCYVTDDPTASTTMGTPAGAIVIDTQGEVSEVTGPAQGIVETLSAQGWSCPAKAGATIDYWCTIYQ